VDHGLKAKEMMEMDRDPDLKSLYGNPRFKKIAADARQRAGLQKSN
jgi:hypothetical protein